MSKFTSIADKLVNEIAAGPALKAALAMKTALTGLGNAKKAAAQDPKDKLTPDEKQLDGAMSKLTKQAARKARDAAKFIKAGTKKKGKVVEAEGDEVAPAPDAAAPPPAPAPPADQQQGAAEPLTTEGEVMYVELALKCLHVDLGTVKLGAMGIDPSDLQKDIKPENAKEIAKILRRIVGEEGWGESFDSKIDALIEGFELKDLQSKLSIEDLKKKIYPDHRSLGRSGPEG